jgi:hypothetical protein
MRLFVLLAVALLIVSLCFADVGPSPPSPDVAVYVQKSDGTPDSGVALLTYHCMGSNASDNGAVTQRLADLPCTGGKCRNDGSWFYKFNPCYDFPEGYFSYESNGRMISTDYFNNTINNSSGASGYSFVVDSESGKIKSANTSNIPYPLSCFMPSLVLSALATIAFLAGKE